MGHTHHQPFHLTNRDPKINKSPDNSPTPEYASGEENQQQDDIPIPLQEGEVLLNLSQNLEQVLVPNQSIPHPTTPSTPMSSSGTSSSSCTSKGSPSLSTKTSMMPMPSELPLPYPS